MGGIAVLFVCRTLPPMLAHIFPPDFERRTFEAKSFLTVVPEV
jgi:hypothetical protein